MGFSMVDVVNSYLLGKMVGAEMYAILFYEIGEKR